MDESDSMEMLRMERDALVALIKECAPVLRLAIRAGNYDAGERALFIESIYKLERAVGL
jgi:hypothetical protein